LYYANSGDGKIPCSTSGGLLVRTGVATDSSDCRGTLFVPTSITPGNWSTFWGTVIHSLVSTPDSSGSRFYIFDATSATGIVACSTGGYVAIENGALTDYVDCSGALNVPELVNYSFISLHNRPLLTSIHFPSIFADFGTYGPGRADF